MSGIKNRIDKFKELRTSRKLSFSFIIAVIFFAQIVGILSLIAISSLQQIISNLRIPEGVIYLNIDVYSPESMEASIPYYIQNQGIYGLSDLSIEAEIFINYIDETTSKNITAKIFSKADGIPKCEAFSSLIGNFSGTFSSFNVSAIMDFNQNFDFEKSFKFLTNIKFRAKYFFNLITFSIALNNIDLTGG